VDANTVRTTTRTFAQDVNKAKALVLVTEDERTLPSGDSSVITIRSSRYEWQASDNRARNRSNAEIGEHVEESQSTIALPTSMEAWRPR